MSEETLRKLYHECAHCGAILERPTEPPHCEDCEVTEDEFFEWQKAVNEPNESSPESVLRAHEINDRFEEIVNLTDADRREIFKRAMKYSDEIVRRALGTTREESEPTPESVLRALRDDFRSSLSWADNDGTGMQVGEPSADFAWAAKGLPSIRIAITRWLREIDRVLEETDG